MGLEKSGLKIIIIITIIIFQNAIHYCIIRHTKKHETIVNKFYLRLNTLFIFLFINRSFSRNCCMNNKSIVMDLNHFIWYIFYLFMNLFTFRYAKYEVIFKFCHSPNNYEWAAKSWVSIIYLQLKFDAIQNDYLTQTLIF